MGKDFAVGLLHKLLKVVRGDLGNQGVDHGDDIHASLHIEVCHSLGDLGTEGQQLFHIVLVVVHVVEHFVATKVRSQGEGATNQAIEGDFIAKGLFDTTHHVQSHGDSARFLGGDGAVAGDGGFGLQRVGGHRGGRFFRPDQVTAQALCFDLQVEQNGQAVWTVEAHHFLEHIEALVRIGQDFCGGVALDGASVNASKWNPRCARGFLVVQGFQQNLFWCHLCVPPYILCFMVLLSMIFTKKSCYIYGFLVIYLGITKKIPGSLGYQVF